MCGKNQSATSFFAGSRASLRSAVRLRVSSLRCGPLAGTEQTTEPKVCRRRRRPDSEDQLAGDQRQGRSTSLRDGLRPPLTPVTTEQLRLVIGPPPHQGREPEA